MSEIITVGLTPFEFTQEHGALIARFGPDRPADGAPSRTVIE